MLMKMWVYLGIQINERCIYNSRGSDAEQRLAFVSK